EGSSRRDGRSDGQGDGMTGPGILVVDIGGSNIKVKHSELEGRRKVKSGFDMTPGRMAEAVRGLVADWTFERITIGCPGAVRDGRLVREPVNLGKGWVGYDFAAAFGQPVRLVNDAVMQA